jgi:hypothetical protein
MKVNTSQKTLMRIIGLQMIGYIILEVIAALLIYFGLLPGMLTTSFGGNAIVKINTAYIMIVGLVSVLISGLWTAMLVESELIEFKNINFSITQKPTRKRFAAKKQTKRKTTKRKKKK